MNQVRLPAKTAIRVDTLIETTLNTLQGAALDAASAPVATSAITGFVESLAQTLLTSEQQQQIKTILDLWKTCRTGNTEVHRADDISILP